MSRVSISRAALALALNVLRRDAREKGLTARGEIADEIEADVREIPEPQPDADGWIVWNGGECPLEDGVPRKIKLRDGLVSLVHFSASDWGWKHNGSYCDIVAYRVVTPW
jgi:hypothetical protein